MSLTEGPTLVERLASDRAGSGWSFVVGHAVYVRWIFGFAGHATAGTGIAHPSVRDKRGPRAVVARDIGIAVLRRERQIIATTSEAGARD